MDNPRADVIASCNRRLMECRDELQNDPNFWFEGCIDDQKDNVRQEFANRLDRQALTNIIESFNWDPARQPNPAWQPAPRQQGGKRKSTRRNTRRNQKTTRKHRRLSRKF